METPGALVMKYDENGNFVVDKDLNEDPTPEKLRNAGVHLNQLYVRVDRCESFASSVKVMKLMNSLLDGLIPETAQLEAN